MEWISVKDRLPKQNEFVLIYLRYGVQATAYLSSYDSSWTDCLRPQHTNGNVTHWMPLPKPPKE